MRKIFTAKRVMIFIFITFIVSAIFTFIRIFFAPLLEPPPESVGRVKVDYLLRLIQCILGAAAMTLPGYLRRKVRLNIPDAMMIAYAVFLYCAIYLGEVRNFYFTVPHWDTVLHALSGAALGALGFSIISLLNNSESVMFSLSPVFVAMFAFCFAVALGVIWEIYEFSADFFLHTNMQKYALETGEALTGREALLDSMKDLVVNVLSAFTVSVVGFSSMKIKKNWLKDIQFKTEPEM